MMVKTETGMEITAKEDTEKMESFDEREELKDMFLDILGHVFCNDADSEGISFGFEERKPEKGEITNDRVFTVVLSGRRSSAPAPSYYRYLAAPSYETAVEIDKRYRPLIKNVCGLKTPLEDVLYVCITKDYSFGIGFTVDKFHLISAETGRFSVSYNEIDVDDEQDDSIPDIGCELECEKINRYNVLRVLKQLAKLKEETGE